MGLLEGELGLFQETTIRRRNDRLEEDLLLIGKKGVIDFASLINSSTVKKIYL